jgi:hypothetical protein
VMLGDTPVSLIWCLELSVIVVNLILREEGEIGTMSGGYELRRFRIFHRNYFETDSDCTDFLVNCPKFVRRS